MVRFDKHGFEIEIGCTAARIDSGSDPDADGRTSRKRNGNYGGAAGRNRMSLEDAYAVLEISRDSNDREIKKAYRRMMSRPHPDKLVARGLPEEMMKLATKKTQEIQTAYELIKKSR